ncbi:MAG TPA: PRC-barrel domain-containing protein [Terriglobales bacterium]|nr:PRC-barrel domain-containing protein [Terriglobales bacterium]
MAHLGTLRDFRFSEHADDIRGATLYGRDDQKLGEISDILFDHETGQVKYAVIDTGGWLTSNEFLVPSDRIRQRGDKEDEYSADLTKKQIETFPAYDEDHLKDEKRWGDYVREYNQASGYQVTGGVMHEAGGTNIIVSDAIPAEGPTPTNISGKPVSGYKSPIHHHPSRPMDTTPMGVANDTDEETLTFVPDAMDLGRGDIQTRETSAIEDENRKEEEQRKGNIVNRENDRMSTIQASGVERTIEGDAVFNCEDVSERQHARGNVHDADVPSYATVGGPETQTMQGRTPNYPDASQGKRWQRFEQKLREDRPSIVGSCSVCQQFQNRHKEDAA